MNLKWGGTILAVLATGVLVLVLLVEGCSTTPSSPSATATPAGPAKPFGSLTIAVNFMKGTLLDTSGKTVEGGGTYQSLSAGVFDSLIDLTPEGQPRPAIAERWEISTDGKAHTFFIRKGVKFQNGDALSGADVKFSIENFIISASASAPAWKAAIDSIVLKDDFTVVLNMKTPQFQLLDGSDNEQGNLAVLPKKYIEEKGWDYFAKNPIGSGPFRVVSLTANSRLELEAMDTHWRTVPKFKTLILVNVPEAATKIAMAKTGELDMATEVSPDAAASLKAAGLRILSHYSGAQWYFAPFWDLTQPEKYAVGDVRVRKALSLAVDRKEVADKIYGGYASPSAMAFVPKTAYFFDANQIKADVLDVEGAKKLLADAGFANGFSTKIWDTGGGGTMSQANLALAGYWRKIGVNADIVPIDYPTVYAKIVPKMTPELFNTFFAYANVGGVFQFERMVTAYHSTRGWFKNLGDTKLDAMIDKVPATANPVEKKKLATEAAVMARNAWSVIPGVDTDTLYAIGPKIGDITPVKGMSGLGLSYETMTHP